MDLIAYGHSLQPTACKLLTYSTTEVTRLEVRFKHTLPKKSKVHGGKSGAKISWSVTSNGFLKEHSLT